MSIGLVKRFSVLACVLMLLLTVLGLAGCGNGDVAENEPGNVDGEQSILGAALAGWTAAAQHNFQNDNCESMSVPPDAELIKAFWDTARMELWFHLPEFDEGEQPTEVWDYWFLVLTDDVVGLDEYGYMVSEPRWAENTSESYGWPGMAVIPKEEVDKFVHTHFGDVALKHEGSAHKMYDFDGENYYALPDSAFPQVYYGLAELLAEKGENGRVVYTALLNDYQIDIGYTGGVDEVIEAAYGDQIDSGEMTMDEAATKMVMDGQTDEFTVRGKLEVKFYIDGNGEIVYLAVSRHYDPEYSLLG